MNEALRTIMAKHNGCYIMKHVIMFVQWPSFQLAIMHLITYILYMKELYAVTLFHNVSSTWHLVFVNIKYIILLPLSLWWSKASVIIIKQDFACRPWTHFSLFLFVYTISYNRWKDNCDKRVVLLNHKHLTVKYTKLIWNK